MVICELQYGEIMPIYAVAGAILPHIPFKSYWQKSNIRSIQSYHPLPFSSTKGAGICFLPGSIFPDTCILGIFCIISLFFVAISTILCHNVCMIEKVCKEVVP